MSEIQDNVNGFEKLLEDSGLKIEYILEHGQFNNVSFRKRRMNPTDFTVYEILKLSQILRISPQDLYAVCTDQNI